MGGALCGRAVSDMVMPSGDGPRDFFISYDKADRTWAEWIAWQLEDAGYRVLVEAWDFVPGTHRMSQIDEGIRGSDRTIAVLSGAYLSSRYVQAEWAAASRRDPTGVSRKLIPVRVEDCSLDSLLGGVTPIDLFDVPREKASDHLLDKIESALSGRAKPDRAPAFPSQDTPSTHGWPQHSHLQQRPTESEPFSPGTDSPSDPGEHSVAGGETESGWEIALWCFLLLAVPVGAVAFVLWGVVAAPKFWSWVAWAVLVIVAILVTIVSLALLRDWWDVASGPYGSFRKFAKKVKRIITVTIIGVVIGLVVLARFSDSSIIDLFAK
ncbi:toll/interleukin-1 receptor domain-containing protein [Frankia gtarii]|uniref:toll/interleukin-1 receptor domain-containing protein n=1 Tax=Frankia gtarii TaxID=2950102 RepID=UPI0021C0C19B|nr:toll/interleukin-1 receptor domain-containing protein [Frankia gtarii]